MKNNQNNNSLNKKSSEDEIDIKPIINTLNRERKLLIGIPLLTSFFVAIFSLFELPVWRGNFQIVISDSSSQNKTLNGLDINFSKLLGSKSGGLDIVTQEIILKSPSVLNPVYKYVVDKKNYPEKYTYSDWINGSLGFEVETGSNVINISYKDNDKEFILEVLKKISLEYKKYSTRDIETGLSNQIKYLESQNKIMKEAVTKSINELNAFAIENRLGTIEGLFGINDEFSQDNQNRALLFNANNNANNNTNNIASNKINNKQDNRFAKQFLLLEQYEAQYSDYSATLKPESELMLNLKVKIDNMRNLLRRPNEILIKFNELQRIAKRDQLILNNIDAELILLKLKQSKEQKPWDIISEPTIEKYRLSPKRKLLTLYGFFISFVSMAVILYFKEKNSKIIFEEKELLEKIKCNYIDTIFKGNQFLNDQLIGNLNKNNNIELILFSSLMNKNKELISNDYKITYKKIEDYFNPKNNKKYVVIIEKGKILESDITSLNKYSNVFPNQIQGWLLLE